MYEAGSTLFEASRAVDNYNLRARLKEIRRLEGINTKLLEALEVFVVDEPDCFPNDCDESCRVRATRAIIKQAKGE